MPEMLLVNPRKRRKAGKKRRSAAQRAATKRMLAANRSRRGSNPKRRRRTVSKSTGVTIMRKTVRRRRSSARRSNPINLRSMSKKPLAMLQPALIGAVGAVGVNTFMSRVVPRILPDTMQATFMTGRVRYLTQALAAIGLGMVAQKVGVKAATAGKMAEGSLTVTIADAIRDFAGQAGIQLGGMGYYLPGRRATPPQRSANAAPQVGNVNALNGMGLYVQGPGTSNVRQMPQRRGMGFGTGRTF